MNTRSKALAAGLAILMAGAGFGWGASRLSSHAQPATSQNQLAQSQETPNGNLTPLSLFVSEPFRVGPAKKATKKTRKHS